MNLSKATSILGVTSNASPDQIKKAYRKLSKKYHPDMVGSGHSEKFKEIKEAYEYLSSSASGGGAVLYTHGSIFTVIRR